MKKTTNYILGLLALATLSQSCKKTLIDINTNPNLLPDVNPEYLFTGATADINFGDRDHVSKRYGTTLSYLQYVVPDAVTTSSLSAKYCDPTKATGADPALPFYTDYFNSTGRDMHRIIDKIDGLPDAQKTTYQGLKAICVIVDVYHAWRVADIFGALPYSQAFNDAKYPLPAYDFDYDLYKVFDQKLKDAATLLKNNTNGQIALGNQDLFYGGDYGEWYGLANTLRIKIAQRYEKRDPAQLPAVLTDIATNFDSKLIAPSVTDPTNDGSFAINHTRDWMNNVDDINVILFNYNACYSFVEFLKSTHDPRINFMLRQNDFGDNSNQYLTTKVNGNAATQAALALPENKVRYWGKHASPASAGDATYGSTGLDRNKTFTLNDGTNQTLGFLSAIQSRLFVKNGGFGGFDQRSKQNLMHTDEAFSDGATIKMKSYFVTYAETCFMMAEIAAKGGNGLGQTASQWYYKGVQASFNQYQAFAVATKVPKADTVSIGAFATPAGIPYLGLQSIYSQAWVHYLMQPDEAWATWKRTGYPQFTDVRAGNNGHIGDGSSIAYLENLWDGSRNLLVPRRNNFSVSSTLNLTNYTAAVQAMMAKDANYGAGAQDTKGRIWWDKF
ncbi:SusD-like starch-binding protein associating with outer membrane [Chitinophaga niastensis]|uniref:SusD-like starch-binding protein associating with outer membrane n=1 Tax=Chitinophaga niastensis TaxID=536980 RepID=A0A2P8HP53_CHINA|nr:SusD/RagB family nutrient-binding outer membrane lipoprotein [Chitinophaga niastensis]PSL48000.1 SusD-like starch-binding protein associating with outer membrane [Chitinophaga niastensis]